MSRWLSSFVIGSVLIGFTSVAAAQGLANVEEADVLFRRGVEALRAAQHEGAARMFRQSHELSPRAEAMCNLALTYERWPGHEREALDSYRRCAEEDPTNRFRDHALTRARALREIVRELPAQQAPVESQPSPQPQSGPPAGPQTDQGASSLHLTATITREGRNRWMLYTGIAAGALAVGSLIGGIVVVLDAAAIGERLAEDYPGGAIPDGSDAEGDLRLAEDRNGLGIGLYAGAGVLGALGVAFVLVDLVLQAGHDQTPVVLTAGPAMAPGLGVAARF